MGRHNRIRQVARTQKPVKDNTTKMISNRCCVLFVLMAVIALAASMALPEPEAESQRGYFGNYRNNNYYSQYNGYPGFYRGYGGYGDNGFFGNRGPYNHAYN